VSIGKTLSAARLKAGLSLEQVSAKTRIRTALIRQIEDDDFASCGGDFYTKGHIRNVARAIGIDPAPLITTYEAEHIPQQPSAAQVFEPERIKPQRKGPNWTVAMAAALAVMAVYGVATIVTGGNGGLSTTQTLAEDTDVAASPPPEVLPPDQNNEPKPSISTTAPSSVPVCQGNVAVRVAAVKGASWLKASGNDLESKFEDVLPGNNGILRDGQVQCFTASERITLRIGNAGALQLTVNGRDIGPVGKEGDVTTLSFGPQGS